MKPETYAAEKDLEETHWWFVGRRRLFAREIQALGLPREGAVLDIGCGTGPNLRLYRDLGFTNFRGVDPFHEAIRVCAEKGLGTVDEGDVTQLPYEDSSFQFLTATDIVEHVDDDLQALREIKRVLTDGGHALLTVPAFQSLWGLEDEISLHKRRYRLRPFLRLIKESGLVPVHAYYFNFLLFLPIWFARQIIRVFARGLETESQVNTPLINHILKAVFFLDVRLAPILHPPFGVSIGVLVRKDSA